MYEYVQTATGWKLCWGGAALYRGPAGERPPVVPAADQRRLAAEKRAAYEFAAAQAV